MITNHTAKAANTVSKNIIKLGEDCISYYIYFQNLYFSLNMLSAKYAIIDVKYSTSMRYAKITANTSDSLSNINFI